MQEPAKSVVSDSPRERAPAREGVVVFTRDKGLRQTLKALESDHRLVSVSAETELAGELLAVQTGVVILDAAAATSPVEQLTERLKLQFPDLVLIVAGRTEDQNTLSAQITSGAVYRFLHKPVSEQRVKLFVEAAWRRRTEAQADDTAGRSRTATPGGSRTLPRYTLTLCAAAILALLTWFIWPTKHAARVTSSTDAPKTTARDPALDELLTRADQALNAGALVLPAGRSAADLFKQALARRPDNARAAAGIGRVMDALLSAADRELAGEHFSEAQKFVDQARSVRPEQLRVAYLAAQIAKKRDRAAVVSAVATVVPTPAPAVQTPTPPPTATIPGPRTATPSDPAAAVQTPGPLAQVAQAPVVAAPVPHALIAQPPAMDTPVERAHVDPSPDPTPEVQALQTQSAPAQVVSGQTAPAPMAAATSLTPAQIMAAPDPGQALVHAASAAAPAPANASPGQGARDADVVSAGSLTIAHYAAPAFPLTARQRGISGWVDLQFVVMPDGAVGAVNVLDAQPAGVFEQSAVDAARKWRYKPVERDGHAVEQRARVRLKFALDR